MYTPEQVTLAADRMRVACREELEIERMLYAYAATLKAAQGGVTDQTLREMCRAYETTAHGFADFTPNERGLQAMRAALEAALSAPEPAAQGEAEALELLAAEYERWGSSVIAKALRANGVGNNAFDYEVAIRAVKRALAPPAQPAERVPEEPTAAMWTAGGRIVGQWRSGKVCLSVNDVAVLVWKAMLAASPSPARGDGKEGVR